MRSFSLLSTLTLLLIVDCVHSAPQNIGRLLRNSSLDVDDDELEIPGFESERTEDNGELSPLEDENDEIALSEDTSITNDNDYDDSTSPENVSTPSHNSTPHLRSASDENPDTSSVGTTAGKQSSESFSTTLSTANAQPLSSDDKIKDVSSAAYVEDSSEGNDNEATSAEADIFSVSILTTLNHSESSDFDINKLGTTNEYVSNDDEELGIYGDDDLSTEDGHEDVSTEDGGGDSYGDDSEIDEASRRSDELVEGRETDEEHISSPSSFPSSSSEKSTSTANQNVTLSLEEEVPNKSEEVINDDAPGVSSTTTEDGDRKVSSNSTSTAATPENESLKFRNEEIEDLIVTSDATEKNNPTGEVTSLTSLSEIDGEDERPTSGSFSSSADIVGLHTDQEELKKTTLGPAATPSKSTEGQTSPVPLSLSDSDSLEGRSASISSPPPDTLIDDESNDKEELGSEAPILSDDNASIMTTTDDQASVSHTSDSALQETPDKSLSSSVSSDDDASPVSTSELTSDGFTTEGDQIVSLKSVKPELDEMQPTKRTSETDAEIDKEYVSTPDHSSPDSNADLGSKHVGTNFPATDTTSMSSSSETTDGEKGFLELKIADEVLDSTSENPGSDTTLNDKTTSFPSTSSKESTSTTRERTTTLVWHGPTVLPRQTSTTSSEISTKSVETDAIPSTEGATEKTEVDVKDSTEMRFSDRYLSGDNMDMVAAVQFLHYHDKASSEQCFKLVDAHWNYATNLTEENKRKQLQQTLEYSLFHKQAWKNATSFAWKSYNDTLLRRWFKSLSILGNAALPEDKLTEFNQLKAEMKNTYSTAKVCPYKRPEEDSSSAVEDTKCNLSLEPDLQSILMKSRDYDELVHVWKAWRDAAGKPIRNKFMKFVNLSNEAASLNGFPDTGDMWREAYESDSFQQDLDLLWEQLRPLYEHLHAYVRRKLINLYGSEKIKEEGPIPAHLFGNMWAQSWVSLLDITQPFPGKPSVDVTSTMEAKNMTALEMFKVSEEFFTSLGLKPMPEEFWKHSLIEKPKDREIICHASAWDFCNGKDYRIKQCTVVTMEDLITVHHEMGHIQYFLQYARQPNVFREGANPGFHEAIGDVLALSVSTPKHLLSIGLLDEIADDPEGDLNFLLRTALEKVSFLPSGYLIDLWRWGLFSGEIKYEEMNTKWWELRLKYQGICPPVKRTEEDFDPGAKYHVAGNVPYIRYFVSFVIQFQFHKVLCDAAGHTGPLYKCDIYRSKEAGQILSQVMELGSSEHWSEAMRIMTGGAQTKMDAQPIMEYFEPLLNWLIEQNTNETLGWESNDATICP